MEESPNTFYLSAEQQNTASLLERLLGKAIADRYSDFCSLAAGASSLRVSRPIAAHALRELESIIRSVLAVPMDATPSDEDDTVKQKRESVRKFLSEQGFDTEAINRAVEGLKPRKAHKDQIRKIVETLGFAPDSDVAKAWLLLQSLFGKAHQRSFHQSLSVDKEFRSQYQQPFDYVIREIAIAFQSQYSMLLNRVEDITKMSDKKEAVNIYKIEIPGALTQQWHFFDRLLTPDWLPFLAQAGLLDEPNPELNRGNDRLPLGQWPAGKYLLRVAHNQDAETRKLVIEAIRRVAASKHPEVQQLCIEILSILPPDESAQQVDIVMAWLNRDSEFFRQQMTCKKLVTHLAEGGLAQAALGVARALLQLWDQDGEIASLYQQQMYAYFLPGFVSALTRRGKKDALRLFSDLLLQAATISGKIKFDYLSSQPVSNDDMANHDIYYALKKAVRESAEILIQEDTASMRGIITMLSAYDPKVFQRLALHLLAKNPETASDLAESYLTDPELIENGCCEYAELATAGFPSLTKEKQQAILKVIDGMADKYRSAWKSRFEEHCKRQPTEEDEQKFNQSVFMESVWKWRTVLPPERQERLSEIVKAQGSPDNKWARIMPNEESPLNESDFLNRPIADIVTLLMTWHPEEKPRQQTVTALAHKLSMGVVRDAKRYMEAANQFSETAPVYVRHLLEGIKTSVENGREALSVNALKLIQTTFGRMHEPVTDLSVEEGGDPNWLWACTAGADLLKAGMRRGSDGIDYQHADLVRALVFGFLEQAPQQPELDEFEDRFKRDAYLGAAATLRGSAVENSILFVIWLSKYPESPVGHAPEEAFANTPTLGTALAKQLEDVSADGRIPRAILGRYLNWIFYLDKNWLLANLSKMFPPDDAELRQAAWFAHLGHDHPIKELMPQLLTSYENEIARIDRNEKERDNYYSKRLADYLVVLYLWGVLPDSLLEKFWQGSPANLLSYAIWHLGMELSLPPEKLPDPLRARGLQYWEQRLEVARNSSGKEIFREEIGAIGLWCAHDQIDSQWLADQLLAVLKAGYVPDNGFSIVEWLAKNVHKNLIKTIEVLEALLDSRDSSLTSECMLQKEPIRVILTKGINSGMEDAIIRSRALVSILSSKGDASYLDLVRQ